MVVRLLPCLWCCLLFICFLPQLHLPCRQNIHWHRRHPSNCHRQHFRCCEQAAIERPQEGGHGRHHWPHDDCSGPRRPHRHWYRSRLRERLLLQLLLLGGVLLPTSFRFEDRQSKVRLQSQHHPQAGYGHAQIEYCSSHLLNFAQIFYVCVYLCLQLLYCGNFFSFLCFNCGEN